MNIIVQEGLPFISVTLDYQEKRLEINNVLIDTGSVSSVFNADDLMNLGLTYEPNDRIRQLIGIGGTEFVFTKQVSKLSVGHLSVDNFEIELGAMNYGFMINGMLGMDFFRQAGAIIDLKHLSLS